MSVVQIKDNIFWVGVMDPELEVFDIIMKTEYGTSYNSYLVRGEEKNCPYCYPVPSSNCEVPPYNISTPFLGSRL
jgi:hypothetical protein